ncbi:MAG: hypothetical protein QM820_44280 [Minicystis sp.]
MNNTGLIEVYRGDLRAAEQVCQLHLRWVARLAGAHGVARCGGLALQAWINLGRLRRMAGDLEGALRHYALAVDALAERRAVLGPLTMEAADWGTFADRSSWLGILKSIYIGDSVKAYISARDLRGADDFLRRARALLGDEQNILIDEAEVFVQAGLGRFHEASAVLGRDIWSAAGGPGKLLRATYRAGLSGAVGDDIESTRGFVKELAARVQRAENFERPTDQKILRYLHHLGGLAFRLELDETAIAIWQQGLRGARHCNDVPLRLSHLDSLLGCAGVGERAALEDERAEIARECLYVPLLKARGLAVDPAALADPIFAELHERLRAVAER